MSDIPLRKDCQKHRGEIWGNDPCALCVKDAEIARLQAENDRLRSVDERRNLGRIADAVERIANALDEEAYRSIRNSLDRMATELETRPRR